MNTRHVYKVSYSEGLFTTTYGTDFHHTYTLAESSYIMSLMPHPQNPTFEWGRERSKSRRPITADGPISHWSVQPEAPPCDIIKSLLYSLGVREAITKFTDYHTNYILE